MPLDAQQKDALRHLTKQHLRVVGSTQRLLDCAAASAHTHPENHFVGDGLFAWWDACINPAHPEAAEVFSSREIESLRLYDGVIRDFHQNSLERQLPIHEFVRTAKFQEISNAARDCYRVFKRFWLFNAA